MLSFKGSSRAAHFGELTNEMYDNKYEEKLKQIIFDTKDSIENGKFGFDNSSKQQCEWCDIKHICHECVLRKENG
jgi:hypothetical protein